MRGGTAGCGDIQLQNTICDKADAEATGRAEKSALCGGNNPKHGHGRGAKVDQRDGNSNKNKGASQLYKLMVNGSSVDRGEVAWHGGQRGELAGTPDARSPPDRKVVGDKQAKFPTTPHHISPTTHRSGVIP